MCTPYPKSLASRQPALLADFYAVVAVETGDKLTRNRFDRFGIGSEFPNTRPGTGKIKIACGIDRDSRGPRDSGVDG
jgi:hypothetical protein